MTVDINTQYTEIRLKDEVEKAAEEERALAMASLEIPSGTPNQTKINPSHGAETAATTTDTDWGYFGGFLAAELANNGDNLILASAPVLGESHDQENAENIETESELTFGQQLMGTLYYAGAQIGSFVEQKFGQIYNWVAEQHTNFALRGGTPEFHYGEPLSSDEYNKPIFSGYEINLAGFSSFAPIKILKELLGELSKKKKESPFSNDEESLEV